MHLIAGMELQRPVKTVMMEIILVAMDVPVLAKLKALLVESVMMVIKNVMVTSYNNVIVEPG